MARLLREPPILRTWVDRQPTTPFTPAQLEFLRLTALGYTFEEICQMLVISTSTAKWHWTNIMAKLNFGQDTAEKSIYRLRAALWFQFNYWNESTTE